MVSYEKSVAMKEKAVQDYLDKKIGDSEFILKLKKAGFGDVKAKQILDQTIVRSLTYRGKAEKQAETKAANAAAKQAKAEAKAAKAADDAERTAKADAIKKANGDVPSVEEVMMRPSKGKPVLGEKGPHKPATHDKKPIETVDNVLANYDPEKAIIGRPIKPKKTRAKKVAIPTSATKAKHDAMRTAKAAEIDKQAGLSSVYTESVNYFPY